MCLSVMIDQRQWMLMRLLDERGPTGRTGSAPRFAGARWRSMSLGAALAHPGIAVLLALIVYLWRATIGQGGLQRTDYAYFNFLADALLHGQLSLRLPPPSMHDLIVYQGGIYLYWPPFPAIVVAPLVALMGVAASDVVYTVVLGALSVALVARLLEALDRSGVAPLDADRRAVLVLAMAFGSVLLILAPVAGVWFTAQIIGFNLMLLAAIAALTLHGTRAYFLTGLALACATATRLPLLFSGVWLAFYLLRRDRSCPPRQRLTAVAAGLLPIVVTFALLAWYNAARFGSPLEMGLNWHNMGEGFQADFERYGVFNLHYLPTNLYYQFIAYPLLPGQDWQLGGSLFLMTPVLFGAVSTVVRERRDHLVWSLVLSCTLLYVPIGLLMGTGYLTFGPRYLLDLMVPILVLTARSIAGWPRWVLLPLVTVSIGTYAIGSWLWLQV